MNGKALTLKLHSNSTLVGALDAPLKGLNILTVSCRTIQEMSRKLREIQPHLVFTETRLLDGNWLDVVRLTSQISPPANVLVVGSEADSQLQLLVRQAGGYAYLSPPFGWFPFQVIVRFALRETEDRRKALKPAAAA